MTSGQFAVIVLATMGAVGARAALGSAYHASHLWIRLALWSLVIVDGIQSRLLTVRSELCCRTPDQTQIAYFYSGNTIALFEGMLRGLVEACELGSEQRYCTSLTGLGDSARLFALANLAGADAGIRCWNSKKHYNFWRPITAIQQPLPEDNDGNPQTEADATWTSLIATPPYPDYTSGANNLSGSFTTIVSRFFAADKVTFKVTTTAALAVPNERTYHRFSDLADDVVDARVYMGIHFRFADTAARREGTRVATQAFNHFLRPVHDRGHDHDKECGDHDDGDDWDRHGRGRQNFCW